MFVGLSAFQLFLLYSTSNRNYYKRLLIGLLYCCWLFAKNRLHLKLKRKMKIKKFRFTFFVQNNEKKTISQA